MKESNSEAHIVRIVCLVLMFISIFKLVIIEIDSAVTVFKLFLDQF